MALERWLLRGGPGAPRAARSHVRTHLTGLVDDRLLSDVELLVSELATNSVRHAHAGEDASLVLELDVSPERLHVRWCDSGEGFAEPALRPHTNGMGGYGLVLVDRLSTRWGVVTNGGFCVWFELALAQRVGSLT